MPYSLQTERTMKHLRIVRLTLRGKMNETEANALMKEIGTGGPLAGLPMLVLTEESTEIGPEARRVFTSQINNGEAPIPVGVVTKSVVMRVTVNFIGRVNGNNNTRMFATETEALRFLEEASPPSAEPNEKTS